MASTTKPAHGPDQCERVFRTKTSSIPKLTTLRKQLGYGNPGGERDLAFKKAVAEQVKTFVSSVDSLPAFKLTKWKNRVHQRGLLEVTKNFLQARGAEFWPDWRSDLNYKRDSSKIRRLMTQVFWRTACEKKRAKSSTSPNIQLSQTIRDALQQPIKAEESASVNDSPNEPSQFGDRGNTVDNPIDLEDMTSNSNTNTNIPGKSTDNDPFVGISIRFSRYPPDENNLQDSATSELFTSSLFSPDAIDGQPLNTTDNHQTVPSNDTWAVPPGPPRATSAARPSNRKRPAGVSSDTNPGQNKKRGGSSNPSRKQVGSETAPTAPRTLKRQRKQVVREGCATEEDLRTLDNSSPLASSRTNTTSEANNEAQQDQQSNGQAQGQVPQTSSSDLRSSAASGGSTSEQSPAELLKAAAFRQARADTEAAAGGVEDSSRVTAGLSVTAQGKQPEIPSMQAQAGSSREREMIERSNSGAETTAPQATGNSHVANDFRRTDLSEGERGPSMFYFNEREREALQGCEMIYETDIEHAGVWTVFRLSNTIFQLSLANVFDELRLIDSATLHLRFGRSVDYKEHQFRRGQDGEKEFAMFKERCLDVITSQRRRAASASVVQGRGVNYFAKFSDGPIIDA
ncbi:uncharacterized protein FIESC28_02201 [Fusarium coffeatum]|uniref:Uncharacterized protein n=1 Tax=Fusarium coffeatum TaxID=231269 RepID=A0A366S6H8_9HYPO|nr:uncharacterized protein FIESC28_02201 [Fusarium coffeatum]RBR24931.1 hypothetical protein FIESC28_02201 [Fusarium coffeatum]